MKSSKESEEAGTWRTIEGNGFVKHAMQWAALLHHNIIKSLQNEALWLVQRMCKRVVYMVVSYITDLFPLRKNNIEFFFLMCGVIFTTLAEMAFRFTNISTQCVWYSLKCFDEKNK